MVETVARVQRVQGPRFAVPSIASGVSVRDVVADRLAAAAGRVVVVRAPAGYGKTTQVACWASTDTRPVAWVRLDPIDNDPATLLPLLTDALASVTDLGPEELLPASAPPAAALGRLARGSVEPFVLVLDDTHVLDAGPGTDLLDAIVRNIPAASTVVLVGRAEPAAHLAELRCEDRLVEISSGDLALDLTDATVLLDGLGVDLEEAEVREIVTVSGGWPVGIRRAGLAWRDEGSAWSASARDRLSQDRLIAAYLREEWLSGLAAEELALLTDLSLLARLEPAICDEILGRTDCAAHLDRLAGERGILVPLDRPSGVYRMHDLLRGVLADRLERDDRARFLALHRRSSIHFERAGHIDEAVEHAFRAGDTTLAEELVRRHGPAYQTRGRYRTVARWLAAFAPTQVLRSADLCLIAAMSSVASGDGAASASWARSGIEALKRSEPTPWSTVLGLELRTWRAAISMGPVGAVIGDATDAYRDLPPGPWHTLACATVGALAFSVGDDVLAREALTEGAAEARLLGSVSLEAICRSHLALLDLETGATARARQEARAARGLVRRSQLEGMPTLALVTAMSALAEASDGNVEGARADAELTRQGLDLMTQVGGWLNVQSRLVLARAAIVGEDRPAARVLIGEVAALLSAQPDATRPRAQLEALEEQLRRPALPAHGPSALTAAELRVLGYLPTNLSIAEIAGRLYVSRNTAKSHAAAVYRKLGASSRSQAVEAARAAGLLTAGEDPRPIT